jgi:site-specific recombinase XerD
MTVINSLFSWLVQARYLDGNPLALRSHTHSGHRAGVTRFLPLEHWTEVKQTILTMPVDSATEQRRAARTRWVFSLLYLAGLRAAEASALLMGNFFERRGTDGRSRWWLEVHGKGSKTRLVPVGEELLAELKSYRLSCGMKPIPSLSEMRPAILPLIGGDAPLSRAAIYDLVKRTMLTTADRVAAKGANFAAAAEHIRRASTHWLRHTTGTHMSESLDVKVVRDHLGHENLATTSLYVHTEEDARHDVTSAAHRVNWTPPSTAS